MTISRVLLILLEVVLLFNFIILVHELGHFLAARARGLYVDRFAIWFGRPLWSRKIGDVTWQLGCIPAGGFVSLPQLSPMEWIEGRTLPSGQPIRPASPLDKIIVAAAGPVFSFGLALIFGAGVWAVGQPVSESELTTTIGYVGKDSSAAKAGLLPGDQLTAIDGVPVTRWGGTEAGSVGWRIVASEGTRIKLSLVRNGKTLEIEVAPEKEEVTGWKRASLRELAVLPAETPMIAKVMPGSPALTAGLQPSDLLTSINGNKLWSSFQLREQLQAGGTNAVRIGFERAGKAQEVTVYPAWATTEDSTRRTAMIGVVWDQTGPLTLTHPTPWRQVHGFVSGMVNTVSALVSPKSDIKPQHLGGPVQILRIYYLLFESPQGWRLALWFSVFMNVNLAILNLMPIPRLDGGHIVLGLMEWIRRRPLSEPLVRWVQTAGAVVVLGFLLYVTSFDVGELFRGGRKAPMPEKVTFETPANPAPAPAK